MYKKIIENYKPVCEQEASDKALILSLIDHIGDKLLIRESAAAHMTASSMIFNRTRDRVLLIYHNIYKSFAWTGGHSDGEHNLLKTAAVEAMEETGLKKLWLINPEGGERIPFSEAADEAVKMTAAVDILTGNGHVKRGKYVSGHLHLNVSYLFEADENEAVRCKQDENSDVQWVNCAVLSEVIDEPWMLPVYEKLIKRGKQH